MSVTRALSSHFYGDSAGSIAAFQENLNHESEVLRAEAIKGLAYVLFDCGKQPEAITLLESALSVMPQNDDLLFQYADFLMASKQFEKARTAVQQRLSQRQESAPLWAKAADICFQEGNFDWANRCAKKSIDCDLQNELASHVMSRLAVVAENFHEAEHIAFHMLQCADSQNQVSGNGHVNMAHAFLRRGIFPMALHHYAKRHEESADSCEYYPELGALRRAHSLTAEKMLIASEGNALDQLRFYSLLVPFLRQRKGDVLEVDASLAVFLQGQFQDHHVAPQKTRSFCTRPLHMYDAHFLKGVGAFMMLGDALMLKQYSESWIHVQSTAKNNTIGLCVNSAYEAILRKSPHFSKCTVLSFDTFKNFDEIAAFLASFKAHILEPSLLQELASGLGVPVLSLAPQGYVWHFGQTDVSPLSDLTKLCVTSHKNVDEALILESFEKFIHEHI